MVDPRHWVVEAASETARFVAVQKGTAGVRLAMQLVLPGEANYTLNSGEPTPEVDVPTAGSPSRQLYFTLRNGVEMVKVFVELSRYVPPPPEKLYRHEPVTLATVMGYVVLGGTASVAVFGALCAGTTCFPGLGAPLGASSAMRSLVLLLQFTSLNNVVAGRCALNDFTHALQWIALFPAKQGVVFDGTALNAGTDQAMFCYIV